MTDVGIKHLQEKIDQWHLYKEKIKSKEEEISDLNRELMPIAKEITEIMEALELSNFAGSRGKIQLRKVDYVNMPQSDEARAAFNEYLKSEGLFDEMVSVHHQKLNSFYKSKLDEAIEQGSELNIPGLEPKQRTELRKGR